MVVHMHSQQKAVTFLLPPQQNQSDNNYSVLQVELNVGNRGIYSHHMKEQVHLKCISPPKIF